MPRTPQFQRGGRGRGGMKKFNSPLSSIPVDKFVSQSIFSDPWTSVINSLPVDLQNDLKQADNKFIDDTSFKANNSPVHSPQNETEQLFSDSWQ